MTPILTATRVFIPAASFLARNYAGVTLSYEACHTGALYKAKNNPKFFETLEKVDALVILLDLAVLFWNSVHFFSEAERKYSVFSALQVTHQDVGLIAFIGIGAWIITGVAIVALINTIFKPSIDKELLGTSSSVVSSPYGQLSKKLETQLNHPFRDKFKQFLYVTRIVINVGLFFFIPTNPLFAINAAVEICGLAIITQRKWIHISKTLTGPISQYIRAITSSYRFLLQEVKKATPREANPQVQEIPDNCSICLENDPVSDAHFCSQHTFHTGCIIKMVLSKSEDFLNNIRNCIRKVITTQHYSNGIPTHTTKRAEYSLELPKNNTPACPLCRERPIYNDFTISIKDSEYGISHVSITWV